MNASAIWNLPDYAREHRLRVRNLHDGRPVPPAKARKKQGRSEGYSGNEERYDAIVGSRGYITEDDGNLGVTLFLKSKYGVTVMKKQIRALEGRITQEGDTELSASMPCDRIRDALGLIRVSKVGRGNPNPVPLHPRAAAMGQSVTQDGGLATESGEN